MTAVLDADRLIVGMQLPIQAQSSAFVEPWEAGAGAAELRSIAVTADRAGFGWAFAITGVVALVAVLPWLFSPETHQRDAVPA